MSIDRATKSYSIGFKISTATIGGKCHTRVRSAQIRVETTRLSNLRNLLSRLRVPYDFVIRFKAEAKILEIHVFPTRNKMYLTSI